MDTEKLRALQEISRCLKDKNLKHALGGSGLLHALGIPVAVNDWDITTDRSLALIKQEQ